MSEAEVRELAGWLVAAQVRCPECGRVHEIEVLASELVGCTMDDQGVYRGRPWFLCADCFAHWVDGA